jgi:hypothetical protein
MSAITHPSRPKQLKSVKAVLWQTSLSLMAITVHSQRTCKRCARLLLSGAANPLTIKAILNRYAIAFSRSFFPGAAPLLGFFHPLLGCNSSHIVAFQKALQLGINPDKCVQGL